MKRQFYRMTSILHSETVWHTIDNLIQLATMGNGQGPSAQYDSIS